MPIGAENKRRYPKDWRAISLSIRERAGWKCEFCGAMNAAKTRRLALRTPDLF